MQPSPAASRHLNPAGSIAILAILIFLAATSPLSAGSPVATTVTTLSVSSAEVTAGTAVTLTANRNQRWGAVREWGGGILRRQRHTFVPTLRRTDAGAFPCMAPTHGSPITSPTPLPWSRKSAASGRPTSAARAKT